MKKTGDYINELLKIYSDICNLQIDDFYGLVKVKKALLNFSKKDEIYNILDIELDDEEKTFLENEKIISFFEDHKKLESISYCRLTFSSFWGTKSYRELISKKVQLYRLNFAKTHGIIFSHGLAEGRKIVSYQKKKLSSEEIKSLSIKIKKEIQETEKRKFKEIKLLKKEKEYLEKSILPFLDEYKNCVEKYFFEIKDYFKWYNKELRVYILQEGQPIFICVYPSSKNSLFISDKLFVISNPVGNNTEEINKTMCNVSMAYPNWEKPENLLRVNNYEVFSESLEIFWRVAGENEKLELIEKVFKILGYKVENVANNLFLVNKPNFYLDTQKEYTEDLIYIFLNIDFVDKYLSEEKQEEITKIITEYKKKFNIESKILIFVSEFNVSSKDFTKENIQPIGLRCLSYLLLKYDLFEFALPFLREKILLTGNEKLKTASEKKLFAESLIKELENTDSGHKNFKKFEDLVNSILEFLFKDSFRQYLVEKNSREDSGHQIRDLIISNISPKKDFWKERKTEQNAKQIIVDAKNYSKDISKSVINDVSQYLDRQMGNFAIVVSRNEMDNSAKNEQKTKYRDNKLIIHLSQNDLISMIRYKLNNQEVEDFLERKIHEIIK